MKRKLKGALSLLLCMIMVFGAVAAGGEGIGELFNGGKAEAAGYSVGDIITFGSYPQSEVTKESDSATYAKLEAASKNWVSYKYYSGDGSEGSMKQGDWMKYADITLGGEKYRAVRFTQYRPYWTSAPASSSSGDSWQGDNGYTINNIYYFKYEPLKWRTLDPETGLVLSESIIDSQAYSNTMYNNGTDPYGKDTFGNDAAYWNDAAYTKYANDYATSSIRKWLNEDFYNTAFASAQQAKIRPTALSNGAFSPSRSKFDSISTTDKVFFLSYSEAQNASYGFTNDTNITDTRKATGTDYAKAQGLVVDSSSGCSNWRLRSAGCNSYLACNVDSYGELSSSVDVSSTTLGIRPALRISNPISYTLSYNANGGSNAPAAQSGSTSYKISSAIPNRSGYTFLGWSKSSSATTPEYRAGNTITLTGNTTLYAVWTPEINIYNLGEETYRFDNFTDNDSLGHCFGMSMTSAGYYTNRLDPNNIGIDSCRKVNTLSNTANVRAPICYYQNRQGRYSNYAIVAGGSYYLTRKYNISSDWNAVVSYVQSHNHDGKGDLQIGFRKNNEGGHAINFLRYSEVNGQQRIYAYDNNFPNIETYFYKDSNGRIRQAPYQTFSGSIDCIALRDVSKYFDNVTGFDSTRYIYADRDSISINGVTVYPLDGGADMGERVAYEVPTGVKQIIVAPLVDDATFEYLGKEYSLGDVSDDKVGLFRLVSADDEAGQDAKLTLIDRPTTKISISTPSVTTVSYGFTLNLHANVTDLPEGARVVWSMDGSGFELIPSADGMTCGVKSVSKGSATITAKVVDKNGNAVKDANGNEITASQQLTSKAGFFQKLAAFFKKLFGSNMVIPYALEWIIK